MAETESEFDAVEDLLDVANSCQVTSGGDGEHKAFLGVNNFLKLPSRNNTPSLNALEFLKPRVAACSAVNENTAVSFLYVDFWSIGKVLEYVNTHNMGLEIAASSGDLSTTTRAGNQWLRHKGPRSLLSA